MKICRGSLIEQRDKELEQRREEIQQLMQQIESSSDTKSSIWTDVVSDKVVLVKGENNPNQRDRDVNRPFELGIFFTGCEAGW